MRDVETDDFPVHPIRLLRLDQLLTQEELAKKAGISPRTVHSIEKTGRCQMLTKKKLLVALGVEFKHHPEVFKPAGEYRVGFRRLAL